MARILPGRPYCQRCNVSTISQLTLEPASKPLLSCRMKQGFADDVYSCSMLAWRINLEVASDERRLPYTRLAPLVSAVARVQVIRWI